MESEALSPGLKEKWVSASFPVFRLCAGLWGAKAREARLLRDLDFYCGGAAWELDLEGRGVCDPDVLYCYRVLALPVCPVLPWQLACLDDSRSRSGHVVSSPSLAAW